MNRVPFKVESCTLPEWLKGDVVSSFNEGIEADSNSPKIKLHKKGTQQFKSFKNRLTSQLNMLNNSRLCWPKQKNVLPHYKKLSNVMPLLTNKFWRHYNGSRMRSMWTHPR